MAAIFILKTKEVNNLPGSTVQSIVSDVNELFDCLLMLLKQELAISYPDISDGSVDHLIGESGAFNNLFRGIDTQHLQNKFFDETFSVVVSIYMHAYFKINYDAEAKRSCSGNVLGDGI